MSAFYLSLISLLLFFDITLAAVPHSHKNSHEREADGAYSPRDHGHHGGM